MFFRTHSLTHSLSLFDASYTPGADSARNDAPLLYVFYLFEFACITRNSTASTAGVRLYYTEFEEW